MGGKGQEGGAGVTTVGDHHLPEPTRTRHEDDDEEPYKTVGSKTQVRSNPAIVLARVRGILPVRSASARAAR
jgi:hypothetical protein